MTTQFETTGSEEAGAEPRIFGVSLGSCESVALGDQGRRGWGGGGGSLPCSWLHTVAEKKAKPLKARTSPFLSACSAGADPAQR